ncbi:MAG: hypothetical protein JWN53_669 [Gemmatimonadetes bacterium]|jgi:uncharacterized protein YbaR (Trm112 family)|nr:hypothetical protein [Gemmatimonadota bacterium]
MFIELVDALRCPNAHEESWLVASADRMAARHILDGMLGCPVCGAEYPIRDGVVDFRRAANRSPAAALSADVEQATRLAAFLGLDDALGFAVLMGEWGSHALELRSLVDCPLVLIDPPEEIEAAPGLSLIRTDGPLPLATGAARGVAIDAGADPERVASALRATRAKGRVVASVCVARPPEVRELARDEQVWVGEREAAASPIVTLHVRRG